MLLIGGGKDLSSETMEGAYKKLKANGVKTELFWAEEEGHFVLINKRKEITDFLNKNLPLLCMYIIRVLSNSNLAVR